MKFTCLQENFAKGLGIVFRAIPTKSSLPVLSNVYISAENDQLKLAATNTETTIITYIGASIKEDGAITVPAKLLKDFVSTLSPSTLTVELKDLVLHISSEKTKSRFNGTDPSDYPNMPSFDTKKAYLALDPKVFATAISHVLFAAATDESKPIFTGVYLCYKEGTLTIASSDGYRLSEKVLTIGKNDHEFTVILPAKTLAEIAKIFSGSNEPLKFGINEGDNLALFESEGTLVTSSMLNGEYPNYKRIIPEDTILQAEFSVGDLTEAVRLTNIFSKEASSAIKMRFNPEGFIHIASSDEEVGAHESKVTAEIEGDEMEITFNSKYLLDFLTNIKVDRVLIKSKGAGIPCLFTGIGLDDFLHVIAPMQVHN